MTPDQKLSNIILSTHLGPVFLVHGMIWKNGQLRCDCREGIKCSNPGKHPKWIGYKDPALIHKTHTTHPGLIEMWHRQYPQANWGVVMGRKTMCLDLDVRPTADPPKDGIARLQQLLGDEWQHVLKQSILVRSGSGSLHLYFLTTDAPLSVPHGVDLKRDGLCVVPGSLHKSGQYYEFLQSPAYQSLVDVPGIVLERLKPLTPPKPAQERTEPPGTSSVDFFDTTEWQDLDAPLPGSREPGKLETDDVVMERIGKSRDASRFFDGYQKFQKANGEWDRSKEDWLLACSLAYWTNHNWHQYVRLYRVSKALHKENGLNVKDRPDYICRTLKNAFKAKTKNSDDDRQTKPRPLSATTRAVIELYEQHPEWPLAEISRQMNVNYPTVRKVMERYRKRNEETRAA